MEGINSDSENILILALTGSVLSGAWLAYKLKLFNFFRAITINDEKKILLPSFLFLSSPFLLPFIFNHSMFPQSPIINVILGAIVSGASIIINTSLNNRFQLKREKEQRIWQKESDRQKWYREKTYESYKTLIHILTKMEQVKFEIDQIEESNNTVPQTKYTELNNLYFEFKSEYSIIIAGHADKDSEKLYRKRATIEIYLRQQQPSIIRDIITKIMMDDSRIKGGINNTKLF